MIYTPHPDLHVIVDRLRRSGDNQAADAIDKLISDLAFSDNANEALEASIAACARAREGAETSKEILIIEIEAAIAKSKQMATQP